MKKLPVVPEAIQAKKTTSVPKEIKQPARHPRSEACDYPFCEVVVPGRDAEHFHDDSLGCP
jgi:hypothetical protein